MPRVFREDDLRYIETGLQILRAAAATPQGRRGSVFSTYQLKAEAV